MPKKRFWVEQIVTLLRQIEALMVGTLLGIAQLLTNEPTIRLNCLGFSSGAI